MQPCTGELRTFETEEELGGMLSEGFEPLPDELTRAAKSKLAGKKSAIVSLTSGGKLSRWAASKRKKKNQRAKAARRANRHRGGA